jgi:hypothetical protein
MPNIKPSELSHSNLDLKGEKREDTSEDIKNPVHKPADKQ